MTALPTGLSVAASVGLTGLIVAANAGLTGSSVAEIAAQTGSNGAEIAAQTVALIGAETVLTGVTIAASAAMPIAMA